MKYFSTYMNKFDYYLYNITNGTNACHRYASYYKKQDIKHYKNIHI